MTRRRAPKGPTPSIMWFVGAAAASDRCDPRTCVRTRSDEGSHPGPGEHPRRTWSPPLPHLSVSGCGAWSRTRSSRRGSRPRPGLRPTARHRTAVRGWRSPRRRTLQRCATQDSCTTHIGTTNHDETSSLEGASQSARFRNLVFPLYAWPRIVATLFGSTLSKPQGPGACRAPRPRRTCESPRHRRAPGQGRTCSSRRYRRAAPMSTMASARASKARDASPSGSEIRTGTPMSPPSRTAGTKGI